MFFFILFINSSTCLMLIFSLLVLISLLAFVWYCFSNLFILGYFFIKCASYGQHIGGYAFNLMWQSLSIENLSSFTFNTITDILDFTPSLLLMLTIELILISFNLYLPYNYNSFFPTFKICFSIPLVIFYSIYHQTCILLLFCEKILFPHSVILLYDTFPPPQ